MTTHVFKNLEDALDYLFAEEIEADIAALPPEVDDLTDEDDVDEDIVGNDVEVFDVPGQLEIVTDNINEEDNVDLNVASSSAPVNKKRKIREKLQTSWKKVSPMYNLHFGNAFVNNIEKLNQSMKGKSPCQYFEEFFTDDVFEIIVRETIRYARTVKSKDNFSITTADLKVFIGFLIFAGYHTLPNEHDYWCEDEDLGIPLVKAAMSRNFYLELKSCLHFQDNSKANENQTDKSFKIRPLIDTLNRNFQKWGVFHQLLSVDEMTVHYYRNTKLKQSIRSRKPVTFGYKLRTLCGKGYCYKFSLYCGKESGSDTRVDLLGTQVVTDTLRENQMESTLQKYCIPIRGKKWYWCLVTRMIDMAIINAFQIYSEIEHRNKSIKDFRREIAVPYLKLGHDTKVPYGRPKSMPNTSRTHVSEEIRFDGLNHIIGKRDKQRRCQFQNCKGKPLTYCIKCNVTLCTTCFPEYHFQ